MKKKSQITIFVLLGLLLLISFGFVYYLKNDPKQPEIEKIVKASFDINPIRLYIQNCIQGAGKDALISIGKRGGYIQLKKPYLNDSNFNLPYYIFNGIDFSPSLKDIEKEISKYVGSNLKSCINNLEEFKKQGFDISNDAITFNTKIAANSISIEITSPLTITKRNNAQKISNLDAVIDKVNLYKIYNVSKEIANLQYKEPSNLCLSCLYELGEKNKLYVDVTDYLNNTLIFDIRDYNSSVTGIYNFTFAVKYPEISCENLAGFGDFIFLNNCLEARKKILDNEIVIETIHDFNIKADNKFFYDVNATGKNILFEDFTDLFEINKSSGIIDFKPTVEKAGPHQIWIRAYDLAGNEDYTSFKINITK